MKTVGFVCEGPRDVELLKAVMSIILKDEVYGLFIQPDGSLQGEFGNGWKGVWRWCEKQGYNLKLLMDGMTPQMDMLVVQMDGDVARKEKEIHCFCTGECLNAGKLDPLECPQIPAGTCPVIIPCAAHEKGIEGYVYHERALLDSYFTGERKPIIVIPCDSTDAWIVAAFDDFSDTEERNNPWENIISSRKDYHGFRIHGHKKLKTDYAPLIVQVCKNWDKVKANCSQAKRFEDEILKAADQD